jgi:hypothetical protein
VSPLRFPQDSRKVAASEAEALLNAAGYGDSGLTAGDAESLAEYPQMSGGVIHFKHAASHRAKRIHHVPSDRNFFAGKAPGIEVDPINGGALRASRQTQASNRKKDSGTDSGIQFQHLDLHLLDKR